MKPPGPAGRTPLCSTDMRVDNSRFRRWDQFLLYLSFISRKVDERRPGKGNSNIYGSRPVHLIITMKSWILTSRLSIKNCLSLSFIRFYGLLYQYRLRHAGIRGARPYTPAISKSIKSIPFQFWGLHLPRSFWGGNCLAVGGVAFEHLLVDGADAVDVAQLELQLDIRLEHLL